MSEPNVLDVRRLLCPMPVIKTQQRVKTLQPGDELLIIATDPGAMHDIPAWCRMYGHKLCRSSVEANKDIHILIEIGAE